MTEVQVSSRIAVREVTPLDEPLCSWLQTMRARHPRYLRSFTAKNWVAVFLDEQMLGAVGFVFRTDGTVFVDVVTCHPSKKGRFATAALWGMLRKVWEGRTVNFCTAPGNRKVGRYIQQYCNARPVAITWECIA